MKTSKEKLEYLKKYRAIPKNRDKHRKISRDWARKNKVRTRAYTRERRLKCLLSYSNNKVECNCCGESTLEFMSIDHINGGGYKHKKSIGGDMYGWLIRNNFPKGFQVLCHNCNLAKGFYGACPHGSQ